MNSMSGSVMEEAWNDRDKRNITTYNRAIEDVIKKLKTLQINSKNYHDEDIYKFVEELKK